MSEDMNEAWTALMFARYPMLRLMARIAEAEQKEKQAKTETLQRIESSLEHISKTLDEIAGRKS